MGIARRVTNREGGLLVGKEEFAWNKELNTGSQVVQNQHSGLRCDSEKPSFFFFSSQVKSRDTNTAEISPNGFIPLQQPPPFFFSTVSLRTLRQHLRSDLSPATTLLTCVGLFSFKFKEELVWISGTQKPGNPASEITISTNNELSKNSSSDK